MSDVRDTVDAAARVLEQAGVPSARNDAEELAAWILGVPRTSLLLAPSMDDAQSNRYGDAVRRRARREPLQHIVGRAPFRYVEVSVGPGVFVPRPETEVVAGFAIERATEAVRNGSRSSAPVIVDLCTGSGAIALSVAGEVPGAVVHAVEVSADALVWARRNVADSGSTVVLHEADATAAGTLSELDGLVDVVVANPPYIPPDAHIRDLEVAAYDPAAALWGGGVDGLDVVRGVARTAARLLSDGGWFVVEHADLQGEAVPELLRAQGQWDDIADHTDLAGRDRFATARKATTQKAGESPA
jgi:release factor glutamine methyltransferase